MVLSEDPMNNTATRLPDQLRQFVNDSQWIFAKTMPTWPHEYLVRGRVDPALFEALVTHIRTQGYEGRFYHLLRRGQPGLLDDGRTDCGDHHRQQVQSGAHLRSARRGRHPAAVNGSGCTRLRDDGSVVRAARHGIRQISRASVRRQLADGDAQGDDNAAANS